MARSPAPSSRRPSLRHRLWGQTRAIVSRIHPVTLVIGILTCSPLYDGVFFATAANGQLTLASRADIWRTCIFAFACFSGGGAVAGALTCTGPLPQRITSLLGVSLTIAVGILTEAGVMTWSPWHLPPFVLLALAVGLLITFLTAVFACWLTRWLDPGWITIAGAAAVTAIALADLGVALPSDLPLGLVLGGIVFPPILSHRRVRRLRCLPRARRIRQQGVRPPVPAGPTP